METTGLGKESLKCHSDLKHGKEPAVQRIPGLKKGKWCQCSRQRGRIHWLRLEYSKVVVGQEVENGKWGEDRVIQDKSNGVSRDHI